MDFALGDVEQRHDVRDGGHRLRAYSDGLYSIPGDLRSGLLPVKRAYERGSSRASEKTPLRSASWWLIVMKSPIVNGGNAGSLQDGAERGLGGLTRMPGRASARFQRFPVC